MEILILLFLIMLNGVFAMSEMAVVSSRKARLQQLADEGRRGATAAIGLANEPSNFLSTIQVGITLIGITSGAFGEAALAKGLSEWLSQWPRLDDYSDTLSIVLVVAGITVASLIIGELVPKRLALLNPEAVASLIAKPMQLLSKLAYPIVKALSVTTDAVVKLLGLGRATAPPVTEEEINVLMEQGAEAGVFQEHEEALVSRIFRLDKLKVAAIMTPRADIVYLDLAESSDTNIRRIVEHGHSRFPVARGGLESIEGIVLARILLAEALVQKPLELAAHLVEPLFVPAGVSAVVLMEQFRRHRQTMAIVVDEYGAVEGLVTLNDAMAALVGEIATAEERSESDLVRRDDGSWLIDGSVTIEQLKAALEIEGTLPGENEGAFHTIGGLMMRQLGRVPVAGDNFECLNWRWEVVDMDDRRVDKVLASPLPGPSPATDGDYR
jgi:putative hemolysin